MHSRNWLVVIVCILGSNVPAGSNQPTGYGQMTGIVGYQQPSVMGTWQPGVMGMSGVAYGSQPAVMSGPVSPVASMSSRPPVGYMQQPVMHMGMQAPKAYPPSTFGTSLHAGPSLWQ